MMATPRPTDFARTGIRCFALLYVTGMLAMSSPAQMTKGKGTARPLTATASPAQAHWIPELIQNVAGGGFDSTGEGIPAADAFLQDPSGIAVDAQGNVYFSDRSAQAVRRISAVDGTIQTVVGIIQGGFGGEGKIWTGTGAATGHARAFGPNSAPVAGTTVQLSQPQGLAFGPDGSLYIADTGDALIYKLDTSGNVTIFAGIFGSSGYSPDGQAATASVLSRPTALAVDASGNVYIAEAGNEIIRMVRAADGVLTTVAGNQALGGGYSGDGGDATSAQLYDPEALALDAQGNLLIAEATTQIIRKVDLTRGVITTVAGTPYTSGYTGDGGPATQATLSNPAGLVVDAAGQIYIADNSNFEVRQITVDGTISTIAGGYAVDSSFGYNGPGTPATSTFLGPVAGVAFDSNGALLIAMGTNAKKLIVKLSQAATVDFGIQVLGSTSTQTLAIENTGGTALQFGGAIASVQGNGFTVVPAPSDGCQATGVLYPGGRCYLTVTFSPTTVASDSATVTVTENASNGALTATLLGVSRLPLTDTTLGLSSQTVNAGDAVTFTATVVSDSGTGPVPTGTVLFVDDNTGNTLAQANLDANGVASITTQPPVGTFQVDAKYQGSNSYSPSQGSPLSLQVVPKIATIALTSSTTTTTTGSNFMMSATVQSNAGTPTGSVDFQIDGVTAGSGTLVNGAATALVTAPNPGVHRLQAVYRGDRVFAAAYSNVLSLTTHGAVLQFTPGSAVTVAGISSDDLHGGFGGDGGPATAAYLHTPAGVSTDLAGNIYIADEQNNIIRKVALDGTISTVAGVPWVNSSNTTRYSGDNGPATQAYFTNPSSVVVDPAGNIYIADTSNSVIREVQVSSGNVYTIAGVQGHSGYNQDGAAAYKWLSYPTALALDAANNLYIADTLNLLVRKLDASHNNLTTVAGNAFTSINAPVLSGVSATSSGVSLYYPEGIAVDPQGDLYISDTGHNLLRKVDANGIITTIGGTTSSAAAADNVAATSSSINGPVQIALDPAGNIYFAEYGSGSIRKIDTAGILTTPIGFLSASGSSWYHYDPQGAPSTLFQLVGPTGVAVALDGSLLATDTQNQTILRSGPSGSLQFGPGAVGVTSAPQNVTLSNVGDAALQFSGIPYLVTGDYAVSAGATQPCDFTGFLAPGGHCNISVAYTNAGGSLSGTVVFAANAAGTPTILLKTNATAVATVTTLSLPGSTAAQGDNLLFLATVQAQGPSPAGSIAFYDGATLMGTGMITNGYASLYVSTLAVGTHSITAQYAGSGYYAASTSDAQSLVITGPGTGTVLTVSSNNPQQGAVFTMTAAVATGNNAAVTEGSVIFYDGNTALATRAVNASGIASYSTTTLSVGMHTITAAYQQNADFAGSTSSAATVTVSGGGGGGPINGFDYIVTVSGLPVTIHRGGTATVYLDYSLLNNFGGSLVPTCGTLPAYATCTFSPARVILSGPITDQTVTLTISTTAPSTQAQPHAMAFKVGGVTVGTIQ